MQAHSPTLLKLKQASSVLDLDPKELQNLVQFNIVSPKMSGDIYLFRTADLCRALVANALKTHLGMKAQNVRTVLDSTHLSWDSLLTTKPAWLSFHVPMREGGKEEMEVKLPFRRLASAMERRLGRVALYRDLPRGRKRPGWKKEFMAALTQVAGEIGDISEEDIQREVIAYRKARRKN